MSRPVLIFLACWLLALQANPQGIQDTIVQLTGVEITSEQHFLAGEAGMSIGRVDSMILADKINLSLSDLLSENTPVFIKKYGRGALATASFRGTAASHTNVLWNGMAISSPMTGMVDFSLIPVYIVDDLELKAGPASIKDHSGGLGGSVNIRNQADWQQKLQVKYIQGLGSYRTFDEFLQFTLGNSNIQSNTRAYHNYSKNDYTFINRGIAQIDPVTGALSNPLDTNDNADYRNYGILQEIYVKPGKNNMISGRYWYQKAERTIPRATSYEGPDNSNLNRQQEEAHRMVLDWKCFGVKSLLLVRSGITHVNLLYTLKNNVPGLGEVPAIYSRSAMTSSFNKISYSMDLPGSFSMEGSMEADWNRVETNDTVSRAGYREERAEFSLFLSVRKTLFNRLNINLMLRQGLIDGVLVPFIPYVGFDLDILNNKSLILKGNIARNFHYPSLNDLYWQPGGNPDLKPEKGFSYESGLEYQVNLSSHGLKTGITAFHSRIENWIIWLPGFKGYWEPGNIAQVRSNGIELYFQAHGEAGHFAYHFHGHYAYTQSLNYGEPEVWGDESYGKQLPYIPLHSGNMLVNLAYYGFFIQYQFNSYSERYTTTSNDITRRGSIYPYFMNDLGIGKELKIKDVRLTAEFKVYNLFDETYHTVLYRPMPGRNYMFVLMIDFDKR